MPFLVDINVLIARTDPRHEYHERVVRWEENHGSDFLVTCPLTENGFLRIYGHPKYPEGPGSPAEALVELRHIRALPNHRFIGDTLTIADATAFRSLDGVSPSQITDVYLLALARRNGLQFATLDTRLPPEGARPDGAGLHVIGP
jgi:hypothetical protein